MACCSSPSWQISGQQRVQWMWKSNNNPVELTEEEKEEWTNYSDVENMIIEHAYQKQEPLAVLDDYDIQFDKFIQMSNNGEKKQRPVRRIPFDSSSSQSKLRNHRFVDDPVVPCTPFCDSITIPFFSEVKKHLNLSTDGWFKKEDELCGIVEKAALGLIIEGKLLGKQREGEHLSKLLLSYKDFPIEEIAKKCAYIYSTTSFVWKKLNETMRLVADKQYEHVWKSKVATLGPFAILLHFLPKTDNFAKSSTVYRGCSLSLNAIEQFENRVGDEGSISFPAFTSTSRSRNFAEFWGGNTLFMIDICDYFDGYDIATYSDFAEEEEFLLKAGATCFIHSCQKDEKSQKWIIHLESDFYAHTVRMNPEWKKDKFVAVPNFDALTDKVELDVELTLDARKWPDE